MATNEKTILIDGNKLFTPQLKLIAKEHDLNLNNEFDFMICLNLLFNGVNLN